MAAALALLSGCAPHWALRSLPPPAAPLQWPFAPNRAKLRYLETLTGVAAKAGAGAKLRTLALGTEEVERGTFVLPVAVATGRDGRIAVADLGRAVVHLFVPGERSYRQLGGAGRERLAAPVGVAFDDELTLYVTDSSGKLLAFAPDGALRYVRTSAGAAPLQRPTGLAFCPDNGAVYVVDTLASRVHAFAKNGDLLFSFGERGERAGQFNFPTHAFCSGGELYVADSLNFRIQVFDLEGAPRAAFGRHGDGSGDLAMPKGVAVDKDGVVYVVDAMFDNVQLFNRQGDFLLTLGQRGTGFGEFWLPSGIFINEKDELYLCDTYNRRVQVFRVAEGYQADAAP